MKVLGIETSCDETAAAIVSIDEQSISLVSNIISSQMKTHKKTGGVVPEVAARGHAEMIVPVLQEALSGNTDPTGGDIDLIAVTSGPGLATSLMVGVESAQALGMMWGKPVVGVNHLEGHVLSPFIEHSAYPPSQDLFPMIVMTVSGGHTQIVLVNEIGTYKLLATTLDDAAGEAFDKVAKMIGLPYPGGPEIDKLAKLGNPQAYDFPRPMLHHKTLDFSFAGLKTAVKYKVQDQEITPELQKDVAASFQRAAVDVLVKKTLKAAKLYQAKSILVAGGVAANTELRERFNYEVEKIDGVELVLSDRRFTTDNAAMIAVAGYEQWKRQNKKEEEIILNPKLRFTK